MLTDAMIDRPKRKASRLGTAGEVLYAISPETVDIILNTAYALFCDRLFETTEFQVPYVSSGFKDLGEALVVLFDETPADPSFDRALVDRWAKQIGLIGKYEWIPLRSTTRRHTREIR
jgi:hypothetical protein